MVAIPDGSSYLHNLKNKAVKSPNLLVFGNLFRQW